MNETYLDLGIIRLRFTFGKPAINAATTGILERDVDTDRLKTVKTEHLVMSRMSLLGNVGGTLGMFVGFSFFGFYECICEILMGLWKWLAVKKNQMAAKRMGLS